ncbi:MAG TPA: TetR/AcrR family transcriptional regulator [Rhizomicrobium sp.]
MAAAARKIAKEKAPRRGARVQHILGESLECFAESGFERVTYDELIARSKVSRGSFYWYFPSKEALYDAVLDFCVNGYVARLEIEFAKTDPKDNIVKRLFDMSLADFNAHRSQYRLLLRPPPSEEAVKKLSQWNDDVLAFLRTKLEPAVKAGKLDRATADAAPNVISALIDGMCVRTALNDENSIAALSKNAERFLSRILRD